ncbi:MAG TPA: hypothetical protein VFD60_02555 [Nitrososphaeraceae archaeon]|nr:hypothetical protein [Nitrososphaeraceae archaeon]
MEYDYDIVRKALVSLAVEKALFEIGKPVYEKVIETLYKEYHCYLPDCYDHPEYLNDILNNLYGGAHDVIVKSIKKQLDEFSNHKHIAKFLAVICQ